MTVEYIKRELFLKETLEIPLDDDILAVFDFFKLLLYKCDNQDGYLQTWYTSDNKGFMQIYNDVWDYTRVHYKAWEMLSNKYNINYIETQNLIKYMVKSTLGVDIKKPKKLYLHTYI